MPKQNQPNEEKREKGTAQAVIREILRWVIPFVIALAAVSYTHIDVYKRQGLQDR